MTLDKIATEEVIYRRDKTVIAANKLISMSSSKDLKKFLRQSRGMPIDKMAEFVGADMLGHILVDAEGFDTKQGRKKAEVKWAFLNRTLLKNGKPRAQASVTNLLTKDCDLLVFVCDDELKPTNSNYIRVFKFPKSIWKKHWKGDEHCMSFQSNRSKWYNEYLVDINS